MLLKTLLDKTNLQQCHRQYLIELSAANEYEKLENSRAQIHTHCNKTVPVSKYFKKSIALVLGI